MADSNGKKKWKTLRHNGIIFPPEYESKGFTITVRNKTIQPNLIQEEMAYQWAKKKDTQYAQDETFQRNFTKDFAGELGGEYDKLKYNEIDFSEAYRIVDMEKDRKDAMTKEERKELATKRKEMREQLKARYGRAAIDGREVEVGNYMAEPPGIFIGRGDHPLRGRWKPRVTARDVTLNMSRRAPRPEGNWKKVVANRDATWLARWTDHLTKKEKYVWLADTAKLKQDMDKAKYVKAEMLADGIDKVLDRVASDMADPETCRVATVCYLIYRTAMRVGDEKDPDEADTVGATTLRKKHVYISDDAVEFDFLGKDSVRWRESIRCDNPRDRQLRKNLADIISKKKGPEAEIFDDVSSRHVNAYYSGIMSGLSAKVFRTYSATKVVKRYLAEHADVSGETQSMKIYHAKRANLEAAIMCNHKRTIPKNFAESLKKRKVRLAEAKSKKPWENTQARLKKSKGSKAKTLIQKQKRRERIKQLKEQIERQKARHAERIEKMSLNIDLTQRTKDYNLGTSLRNYVDPRVVKAWTDRTKTEWKKIYTAALQKKFLWVANEKQKWSDIVGADDRAGTVAKEQAAPATT